MHDAIYEKIYVAILEHRLHPGTNLRVERVGLLTLGSALLPAYRQRVEEVGVATRMAGY